PPNTGDGEAHASHRVLSPTCNEWTFSREESSVAHSAIDPTQYDGPNAQLLRGPLLRGPRSAAQARHKRGRHELSLAGVAQTPMTRRCAKLRSSRARRTLSAASSMSYSIRLNSKRFLLES